MSYAIIAAGVGAAGSYLSSRNQPRTQTDTRAQSQDSQSTYRPNEALMPSYNNLIGLMNFLSGQNTPYFPGQTYVSPSQYTQEGVQSLYDSAMRQGDVANTAMGNYGFLSNAADVANNPYVQGMLGVNKQQANQALMEDWLPAISNQAQQVNALGSGRAGIAQAQGIERAATQLNNANQQLMNTAYGQGLGAQQSALGQTGALQSALAAPGQTMVGAGGLIEGYQGKALQDAMARFQHQYESPWERAQRTMGLLSGSPLYSIGVGQNNSFSQGSTTGPNPQYMSPWQSLIGGASTGFGMYDAWQRSQQPRGDLGSQNTQGIDWLRSMFGGY